MPNSADPTFAKALQDYLTLHKRRSSYSSPTTTHPLSPSTTSKYPLPSRTSRQSSTDSTSSITSSSSSYQDSRSTTPLDYPATAKQHANEAKLQEIDQSIFALLEEMLRSKTASSDKKFRNWLEVRLVQKERDLRAARED